MKMVVACGLQIWFDGGVWVADLVRGGWPRVSRWQQVLVGARVSSLADVAWRRPMGVGCMEEVQGRWCIWPEIMVARLVAIAWVVAAMAEIGQKGRVGVALP